ncbi:MAG: glycosyltransferase [Candidatus Omnitrophota bacterium]|nr:glycosyltransferase [Candidatus Omnitrophota bacterium]
MKRIAHFVEYFPVAGNDYIYNQVINNQGAESLLITEWLAKNKNSFNLEPFYYNRYSRFSFFNKLNDKLSGRIFNKLYIKKFSAYAQRILEDNKISIMHAHFGSSGYKLIDLKKKLNIPLVVTFYGWDASYCLKNRNWLARFKPLFEFADKLIVLCDEVRERFIRLGCLPEKICVWNIGIDLDKFPYHARAYREGEVKLLTAARFVEKKGYPTLLRALAILAKKRKDIRLTALALGYGPLKSSIEQMVADLGLKNTVTLIDTSRIEDFNQFYRQFLASCDIFVLPSTTAKDGDDESGPALSLVCAQAAGLPVVATPFVGASRSILDNQTGLYTENGSAEGLAEKLNYLIDNPDLWNKLGEVGSYYVREKFSLPTQLKALERIYDSLS